MAKAKKAAASHNPNQLYELLRVERTATDKEIRKAYLVLSRAVHPDRNPSPKPNPNPNSPPRALPLTLSRRPTSQPSTTPSRTASPPPRCRS